MKHRIALCVGLTALAVVGATSAQAQVVYGEPPRGYVEPPDGMVHDGLPPNEALMIARSSGLRPLTQPARRGPNWVLLASDNMGGQLRVVINAQTGRIVHAAPAYDPRFAYGEPPVRPRGLVPGAPQYGAALPPPPSYVAPPADLRTPSQPPRTARTSPPAGAKQNPSLAGAPETTGSVPTRPTRTPLPRPRPTMAANEAGAPAPTPPTQARPVETSPEAEAPAAAQPAPAAPSAAAAKPAPTETQMVPVAPLD